MQICRRNTTHSRSSDAPKSAPSAQESKPVPIRNRKLLSFGDEESSSDSEKETEHPPKAHKISKSSRDGAVVVPATTDAVRPRAQDVRTTVTPSVLSSQSSIDSVKLNATVGDVRLNATNNTVAHPSASSSTSADSIAALRNELIASRKMISELSKPAEVGVGATRSVAVVNANTTGQSTEGVSLLEQRRLKYTAASKKSSTREADVSKLVLFFFIIVVVYF
jgi:hypothetical protein